MKIKVNRKELSKHISIVQKAISPRTTMQILEGILIIAKDNTLTLIASDEKLSIKSKLSAVVEEDGNYVVNSRLFGEIIRRLQDDIVNISVNQNNMHISANKSEFDIQVQNSEEFPDLPKIDNESTVTINSEDFKEAVRKTSFAVSLDETRKNFTGVFMNVVQGSINFVALDGFRMALKSIRSGCEENISVIIPARALNEIGKIIEEEEDIKVDVSFNQIKFTLANTEVYTTRISGEFFNYEGLIRNDHTSIVKTKREDIENSLERASLLAKEEKANLIKLDISGENILITSNSEIGSVKEEVAAQIEGEDLKIAFNSKYLLEGIKNMTGENLTFNFTDSVNPCIIKEDEDPDYIYLVLPVRLAN
ncbi:DNA polymerase III subunit beta [Peptoniphilus catoniae]|uniref:DNA polymerase III subunit beta n=1 Tax=Peptoniphilus catoniae TaxID=1660341 RepID=UPI0010FE5F86|nr:DNA polymerase III subunit beta [Peptoniphilus catoniae]